MSTFARLLGYFNRVWRKDPAKALMLRIDYRGASMAWSISGTTLTTTTSGEFGPGFTVDFSAMTIQQLGLYIGQQAGFTAPLISNEAATLSAVILLEQSGGSDVSLGDRIYGYTNPLWVILKAFEGELLAARAQIANMLLQMATTTAVGEWLDYLANYYDQTRELGETDAQFGPRIIAEVLQPRGNNISIAKAVTAQIGQPVQVVDVVNYIGSTQTYNGSFAFDGSHTYNGTSTSVQYGLFDIQVGFDLLGSSSGIPTTQVLSIVERMRDGGTQLRNLVNVGGTISDASTRGETTDSLSLVVTYANTFDGTYTYNGAITYAGSHSVTETD